MKNEEIKQITELAESEFNGDLNFAIGEFLGAGEQFKAAGGVPVGFEAAVGGIRDEIERQPEIQAARTFGSATAKKAARPHAKPKTKAK